MSDTAQNLDLATLAARTGQHRLSGRVACLYAGNVRTVCRALPLCGLPIHAFGCMSIFEALIRRMYESSR